MGFYENSLVHIKAVFSFYLHQVSLHKSMSNNCKSYYLMTSPATLEMGRG